MQAAIVFIVHLTAIPFTWRTVMSLNRVVAVKGISVDAMNRNRVQIALV